MELDGRPMSGDIGRGATAEAIKFAQHVVSVVDKPKGFYERKFEKEFYNFLFNDSDEELV